MLNTMGNSCIRHYEEAILEMAAGVFDVPVHVEGDDEIAALGRAVSVLSQSLGPRFSRLGTLLAVTGKINNGLDLEEVLDHIYDAFTDLIPYNRIGCALIDETGEMVESVWARSDSTMELRVGYSAPLEGSSLSTILETGDPRIINDLTRYYEGHPSSVSTEQMVAEGIRSSLTCPLIGEGRPIGFLFFSSRNVDAYASVHVTLFQQIASQVSVIIEKGKLYQDLLEAKHKLQEANRALEALSNSDGLTGIANRRCFDISLERDRRMVAERDQPLSVIMIDIDFFKQYNDIYGHLAGDDCLKQVAQTLASCARRGTDLVARFGGEEFVVLLPNTGLNQARKIASKLRGDIEALKIEHKGSELGCVTVSLGVASRASISEDRDPLALADEALLRAKEAGRNRVV